MSSSESNQSRRNFLKTAVVGAAVTVVAGKVLAEQKRGGSAPAAGAGSAKLTLLSVTDPTAKALNYHDDKAKIKDASMKIDRQGIKFNDQHCKNCLLFKSAGKVNGVEAGSCTLFAGKAVAAEGWCTSWSKKA